MSVRVGAFVSVHMCLWTCVCECLCVRCPCTVCVCQCVCLCVCGRLYIFHCYHSLFAFIILDISSPISFYVSSQSFFLTNILSHEHSLSRMFFSRLGFEAPEGQDRGDQGGHGEDPGERKEFEGVYGY